VQTQQSHQQKEYNSTEPRQGEKGFGKDRGSSGPVTVAFAILGLLTIAGSAAALVQRNLVHCVLALVAAFVGLAGLYLQLSAQFLGFAQILVYVGAVAILIVFAILLTRGAEPVTLDVSYGWITGSVVAAVVFGVLAWTIHRSAAAHSALPPAPHPTVKQIGHTLMSSYVLPLEVIGMLLTAALIGAVTIALHERAK